MLYGIICAMPEEFGVLEAYIQNARKTHIAGREFIQGRLGNAEVVAVVSRIGKVAAAVTCTLLIDRFGVSSILFCGIAGSLKPQVKIGDIVVADQCVQHDFYLSDDDLFRIPIINKVELPCDPELSGRCSAACHRFLKTAAEKAELVSFWHDVNVKTPQVHIGAIASGDQFISGGERRDFICRHLPQALCVEMEGAAVAQVCFETSVPCAVIRVVSDGADSDAEISSDRFAAAASLYTGGILCALFE